MNVIYITVCTEYKNRKSYGIAITETANGESIILKTIADISPIKIHIDELVSLCNELYLHPLHLDDVIEDFLAGI